MTTLHLGVVEIPYSAPASPTKPVTQARKGKANAPRKVSVSVGGQTTGDVADILEAKYHVMEHFYQLHEQDIASALEESLAGSLENLLLGAPPEPNLFADAEAQIGTMFKQMLAHKELDSLGYPGIPTQAALKGVSHRRAHPYAKGNPPRPSLIDTGEYQASFKAWLD